MKILFYVLYDNIYKMVRVRRIPVDLRQRRRNIDYRVETKRVNNNGIVTKSYEFYICEVLVFSTTRVFGPEETREYFRELEELRLFEERYNA